MKRIMVMGAGGMTGSEVSDRASPAGWKVRPLTHEDVDITDAAAVEAAVREFRPVVVVNCAAFTEVDRAESEPDAARAVNTDGARNVARAATSVGAPVIHVSTDYVFDGQARQPYEVDAQPAPMGVYGRTKLAGELAVREENPDNVIVRTSWVFSHRGSNFVRTILRLAAEKDELRVVDDQIGRPTSAADLAEALLIVADALFENRPVTGTYHFANSGETSWFGFAQAIFEEATPMGGLRVPRLVPIKTPEFPVDATRPAYSVLDTTTFTREFKLAPRPWRAALRDTLATLLGDTPTDAG